MMNTLEVRSLSEWHNWLEANHDRVAEVWVVYNKKDPGLRYQECVEEALCFGWIDSLIKNIDESRHARKFTPRKPDSKWSELNIERAQRMVKAGRMTDQGRRLFEEGKGNVAPSGSSRKEQMETWRLELIERMDEQTLALFSVLSPSHQRQYAGWVMSGKKEETRQKRLAELSSTLARGEELGLR